MLILHHIKHDIVTLHSVASEKTYQIDQQVFRKSSIF